MAKLAGKNITSKSEISVTVDVAKELGLKDVPDRIVQEYGQAIIDKITNRTESGNGVGGKKLTPKYSDAYRESEEFKDAGKTKKVNMTLSGDMLDSIDIKETIGAKVKVAVGGDETPKAFNHQTGDTLPKRQFFGLTRKELNKVNKLFTDDIRRIKEEKTTKAEAVSRTRKLDAVSLVEEQTTKELFEDVFASLFEVNNGQS